MNDDMYKLAGTVRIPEDRKEEFNRHILKILDVCGIRKTEEMKLGGQTVTVVRRPEADEQGIVNFDYSIFEKKKRKTAIYNMNTCELVVSDRGYGEFGLVMNIIMVMQEAYSEERCYFMYRGKPGNVEVYALLIRGILGIKLNFSHRAKTWDMLLFMKNTEEYQNVTWKMILDAYSFEFCEFIPEQFLGSFGLDSETIEVPEEPFTGGKTEIKEAVKGKLKYFAYQVMAEIIEREGVEHLENYLKELLDAHLQRRQELAKDDRYGLIAEISLYVLPSVIVHGYAVAIHQNFWDVWKKLEIKGYSEIIMKQRDTGDAKDEEDSGFIPFYRAIQRDNEDEFIEFRKNRELHFSDTMKNCLADWKKHFGETDSEKDFDMEIFLAQIAIELDQVWRCRLVDKEFITEFMSHREDENYRRALLFYREIMDEDTYYFPELTREQANCWIIRNNRCRFGFTAMSAFQSLLVNHEYRCEILGF